MATATPLTSGAPAADTALECSTCGATLDVPAGQRTAKCAFCASPHVIERPAHADRPEPRFVLAFIVPPERALQVARRWQRSSFWAPEAFRKLDPEAVRGVYAPAYLYSAVGRADYETRIGEHYWVTTTSPLSNKVERERKTEWFELRGRVERYMDEHLVTASAGIPNDELERIEPFDLGALRRYTPALISGWSAEEPSLTPQQSCESAHSEALGRFRDWLADFMPGDKNEGVRARYELRDESFELVLLPLWVLAVRYHPKQPPVRLLINGQTGKLTGRPPVSKLKVSVCMVACLSALAILLMVSQ